MNVALLGLTHPHSGVLLTTLENLREIRRVFLWDIDRRTTQETSILPHSLKAVTVPSLDVALAGCDFAIVCVRNDLAAALALRVVAAGKHLLAEKPVGLTSNEILAVQRAAEQAGVVASVLYPRRLHPCAVAARKLIRSHALGPLFSFEARFLTTQVRFRDPRSWLFRRRLSGGGILLWLGCHCLDLLEYITGDEIAGVAARTATRSGERIDVEDTAALALEFRSGAIGTFHTGYTLAYSGSGFLNATGNESYFACNGRSGRIVWAGLEPHLYVERSSGKYERRFQLRESSSYAGAYGEAFVRQFIAAIRRNATPPTTLSDAVHIARVIEASITSARTGMFTRVAPTR